MYRCIIRVKIWHLLELNEWPKFKPLKTELIAHQLFPIITHKKCFSEFTYFGHVIPFCTFFFLGHTYPTCLALRLTRDIGLLPSQNDQVSLGICGNL